MSSVAQRRFALEHVVGRELELERLRAHIAGEGGPLALLLEGVEGIGKTTLWRAGIEFARERDYRVLVSRPTAAECGFSFGGLRDLLAPSAPDLLPELPPPRRHALEVALALASGDGPAVGEGMIGVALLSSLQLLARQGPVLIAIDDVQWLDRPSAAVLEFAARRLTGDSIKLLIASRTGAEKRLLRHQRDLELVRIEVGPLSLGALHRLVVSRLGEPLPRPTLRRVHEVSAGNPFYGLEIARHLVEGGAMLRAGESLPIPQALEELLRSRLNRLPQTVRDVLAVVALLADPTAEAVAAASGAPESVPAYLDSAVAEGVLELEGDRIRFAHPLFAAAVVSALRPRLRRRALHAKLAQIAVGPQERARHLAAASEGTNADVANMLEEAARDAAVRGAPAAAAELMELAAQRTPEAEPEARWRRLNESGLRYATAGDLHRARQLLEPLADDIPPSELRAEVLLNLADFRWDDHASAIALAEGALAEVGDNDACRARIHMLLSARAMEAGAGPALHHIRAAHDAAKRSGDDSLSLLAYVNRVHVEVFAGEPVTGLLEEALAELRARDARHPYIPQFESPHFVLGLALLGLARFTEAKTMFERARVDAVEQGVAFAAACAHELLAEVECRLGNVQAARVHAAECAEHYQQLGMENQPDSLFATALVSATLGNVDEARTAAERGATLANEAGQGLWSAANRYVLGLLELSLDNPRAAVDYLQPPEPSRIADLWHVPINHDFLATAVEAMVLSGDQQGAANIVDALEERARRRDSSWERAVRARCHGLLRAAEGDRDAALVAFDEALRADSQAPLDRARTLLARGTTERRANRKRAARSSLETALREFEQLGARLWAKRASAELSRIGGRAPAGDALTATERRVAELAATGLANKEIAASLFVTVKAVEANLTRIYSKLGARSRIELAHRIEQQTRDAADRTDLPND